MLVLKAPDTDGGTLSLTFHAPPCTRPLKKKCRTPQAQPNLFHQRKAVLQCANWSSLLILTQLPSIQSWRNRPGMMNAGLLLYESTTPCEMKPRMLWLRVREPGWILHFPFSLYKVRVCFIVSIFHLLTPVFSFLSTRKSSQHAGSFRALRSKLPSTTFQATFSSC